MAIENILALPLIVAGIATVLIFWGALGTLIMSVVVALFTATIGSFGLLLGILIGVLALIYFIGMTAVI